MHGVSVLLGIGLFVLTNAHDFDYVGFYDDISDWNAAPWRSASGDNLGWKPRVQHYKRWDSSFGTYSYDNHRGANEVIAHTSRSFRWSLKWHESYGTNEVGKEVKHQQLCADACRNYNGFVMEKVCWQKPKCSLGWSGWYHDDYAGIICSAEGGEYAFYLGKDSEWPCSQSWDYRADRGLSYFCYCGNGNLEGVDAESDRDRSHRWIKDRDAPGAGSSYPSEHWGIGRTTPYGIIGYELGCGKGSRREHETTRAVCRQCQTGQYQDQPNHMEKSCKSCDKGKYCENKGREVQGIKCEYGNYQNQQGQTDCKICPVGYKHTTNRYSCAACPKGYYQDQTEMGYCKHCQVGRYQDETGKTSCKRCSVGRYSDETTRTSNGQCKECAIGRFEYDKVSNSVGKGWPTTWKDCEECPFGRYQDQTGKSDCKACDSSISHWQCADYEFTGSENNEFCPLGLQKTNEGCARCSRGTSVDQRASATCNECANEEFGQIISTFSTSRRMDFPVYSASVPTASGFEDSIDLNEVSPPVSFKGYCLDKPIVIDGLTLSGTTYDKHLECRNACLNRDDPKGDGQPTWTPANTLDLEPTGFVVDGNKCRCEYAAVDYGTMYFPERSFLESLLYKGSNGLIDNPDTSVMQDSMRSAMERYSPLGKCNKHSGTEENGYALNVIIPDELGWCDGIENDDMIITIFHGADPDDPTAFKDNDNDGATPYERKRNCAYACMNKAIPGPLGGWEGKEDVSVIDWVFNPDKSLKEQDALRQPVGFAVDPISGRCYCELAECVDDNGSPMTRANQVTSGGSRAFHFWRINNICTRYGATELCN